MRNKVQQETLTQWILNNYFGYALISMGVGKSKIIADAINHIMSTSYNEQIESKEIPILIGVNTTVLRDRELPLELEKWGCKYKVKIACYQAIYKWKKSIGLFIADELDFALSDGERYARSFTNNTYDFFLGMTGSLIQEKYNKTVHLFQQKPFYSYPLAQAQKDGVINKTKIWLHDVPFDTKPTIDAPYGEVRKYIWINGKIADAKQKLAFAYHALSAADPSESHSISEDITKWGHIKKYWESSGRNKNSRLKFLRSAESLIQYAIKLKYRILLNSPDHKILIFAELTEDVDKITPSTYHSKSKNNDILTKFNEGNVRELGVVKKVNRGVNFIGLDNCIVQSFSSSLTNAQQAFVGRMVRLSPDELAHIHILVSYYLENGAKVYAQNLHWALSFLETPELAHIEIVRYDKGLN